MASFFDWLQSHPSWIQALYAGLFTWGLTALGAAVVFVTRRVNRKLLDGMLGFAAGVMIAASFWSLLAPAVEMSAAQGGVPWVPAVVGFLAGGIVIRIGDALLPHFHPRKKELEGLPSSWRRSTLLLSAITLHNIPEGLAVGVAFGAAANGLHLDGAAFGGAVALAIGIGLQNFPEGVAVSMPLRGGGMSRLKSFWYGQLSGFVEPVSAVLGAFAVLSIRPLLPYALAFAAGAMIFVVIEELIPESQARDEHGDLATMSALGGFAVMMLLDVALG